VKNSLVPWIVLALITVFLVKSVDLLLLYAIPAYPRLFVAGSGAHYTSYDFDSEVRINAFGFRGAEQAIEPGQIVVVGDSFTFGFGLPDGETWPERLQAELEAEGDARAVYNLGVPGTDTLFHIRTVRRFLAHEPSLVVVAVLLADDIQQVYEARLRQTPSKWGDRRARVSGAGKDALRTFLPGWYRAYGLAQYFQMARNTPPQASGEAVTAGWADDARRLLALRSTPLPAELQDAALRGLINPGLLQFAVAYPNRSWEFWSSLEANDPVAVEVVTNIAAELESLNREISEYGGRLEILSMPSGEFVRSAFTANYRHYGANIPERNLSTIQPERLLGEYLAAVDVSFVPSLEWFRANALEDPFFPTDGHPNAAGSEMLARFVRDHVVRAGTPGAGSNGAANGHP
jgi:hypothetical protein